MDFDSVTLELVYAVERRGPRGEYWYASAAMGYRDGGNAAETGVSEGSKKDVDACV